MKYVHAALQTSTVPKYSAGNRGKRKGLSTAPKPEIIHLAVGFSVSYEAGAHFIQHKSAVGALETGGVPLEVRRHTQDKLVQDRTAAAGTHACPSNSWHRPKYYVTHQLTNIGYIDLNIGQYEIHIYTSDRLCNNIKTRLLVYKSPLLRFINSM